MFYNIIIFCFLNILFFFFSGYDDATSINSTSQLTKGADNQISDSRVSLPFTPTNIDEYSLVEPQRRHSYNDNDSFQIVFEKSIKSGGCDNDDDERYCDTDNKSDEKCDTKSSCAVLSVEDNNCKDSVIMISSSTASNTTETVSVSDNNNCNYENDVNIKNRKSNQNFKRSKRPNSLSLRKGEIDIFKQKSNDNCYSSRMFLFIQMQLCRKESLREWLECNKDVRDHNQVLSIFEQIVQAVEYVHLKGLIHRDLKVCLFIFIIIINDIYLLNNRYIINNTVNILSFIDYLQGVSAKSESF